jgi:hypothetical protein
MKPAPTASAPDEVVVFQSYIDLINSERETLWARHNALLLANSIIIGSLALSPAELWENKWAALAMLSAGLVISAVWLGLCVEGWSACKRTLRLPEPLLRTALSTFPIRSPNPSATARILGCIALLCC